jgi:Ca2+/Na+ antiporter
MDWHQLLPSASVLMLTAAAFALYIASRVGVVALHSGAASVVNPGVGPATLAQWLPIAAVAILALRDAPEVSVNITFASSVACMLLVLGTMFFSSPAQGERELESRHRRAWGMLLPAAVLAFLAGFAAQFTLTHALLLVLQGIVTLMLWMGTAKRDVANGPAQAASPFADEPVIAYATPITGNPRPAPGPAARMVSLVVWLILTLVGAWLGLRATDRMTHEVNRLTGGMIAAVMIAPALVLPVIGSSLNWARHGESGSAISCAAGCALLNLCVLLPVMIVTWQVAGAWHRVGPEALWRGTWLEAPERPLAFPMATWRVDAVLLVILGATLLIFSTGRWVPRRWEGLILLLMYGGYMIANRFVER